MIGGSSIIDLLIYIETEIKDRRVFLDYRKDPENYSLDEMPEEAREYLTRSDAHQGSPIERLAHMNPGAIGLYKDHGIDLYTELLEVRICAQHNNGGLAGNIWWESTNIKHFFPIGEVNGSHGVARPGGSALNAGQVAGFRAAEYIANRYQDWTIDQAKSTDRITDSLLSIIAWREKCLVSSLDWSQERKTLTERMSASGAHIRSLQSLEEAVKEAYSQYEAISRNGCSVKHIKQIKGAFQTRQLCLAHAVYLDAIKFAVMGGVGSRGSSIVLDESGEKIHQLLDSSWRIAKEDPQFRSSVLESVYEPDRGSSHEWVKCRPIPEEEVWFETAWSDFRNGKIYG